MLAGRYAAAAVALAVLLLPTPLAVVAPPPDCDSTSSYAADSTFQANLNRLAMALPINASASPAGFATGAIGTAPDQANGLALCRGDTNVSPCAACVAAAFRDAQQACPLFKGATAYRDACVILFAGSPAIDTDSGSVNASDAWFRAAVMGIFTALVDHAASATNATRKYFATGEMDFDPKLYGLAQCAPDLTPVQCRDCLGNLQNQTVVATRSLSGRPPSNSAFVEWCFLRYSVSPVYDGRAMLQLAAPPEPPPSATLTPPSSGLKQGGKGVQLESLQALPVLLC